MFDRKIHATSESPRDFARSAPDEEPDLSFRKPTALDGPALTALISACPPLDTNSAYCTLLLCSDFADTCIVAERDAEVVGWISGYRPPTRPAELFVWQVAVSPAARGCGLGGRMLDALLARAGQPPIERLTTTITADNRASWALFEAFARRQGAGLERTIRFEKAQHFDGAHDSEWQAAIGPLNAPVPHLDR